MQTSIADELTKGDLAKSGATPKGLAKGWHKGKGGGKQGGGKH
jgi:hypothetical protein